MKNIWGIITSCLILVSCGTPNNQTRTTIPLGIALALTSNASLFGQEALDGALIAQEYFNQTSGIDSIPINLVIQDTSGDEAGAINAFQALINRHQVVGIVGPTLSQQAFGANPTAERAKVPVIGASNTATGIPQLGQYISRVSAPMSQIAPKAIAATLKLNPQIKKIAVFYAQNDAASKLESLNFQQAIKNHQLDIVTIQTFQTTDTDFQSQITNAINLKPDLIVISALAVDGGNLVRQLRELGYQGIIVGGNGFNTSNIFKVCKALCQGILVVQAYSPAQDNQINKIFRTAYEAKFKKVPPQFSAQAFTAVQVYVTALRELNKTDQITTLPLAQLRTKLNQQILKGKYLTPLGEISFTPEGEIIQKDFYVSRLKVNPDNSSGQFELITKYQSNAPFKKP